MLTFVCAVPGPSVSERKLLLGDCQWFTSPLGAAGVS